MTTSSRNRPRGSSGIGRLLFPAAAAAQPAVVGLVLATMVVAPDVWAQDHCSALAPGMSSAFAARAATVTNQGWAPGDMATRTWFPCPSA